MAFGLYPNVCYLIVTYSVNLSCKTIYDPPIVDRKCGGRLFDTCGMPADYLTYY